MLSNHRRTATALPSRHWVKISSMMAHSASSVKFTLRGGDGTGVGELGCIRPSKERTATVRDTTGAVQLHYSDPVAQI